MPISFKAQLNTWLISIFNNLLNLPHTCYLDHPDSWLNGSQYYRHEEITQYLNKFKGKLVIEQSVFCYAKKQYRKLQLESERNDL